MEHRAGENSSQTAGFHVEGWAACVPRPSKRNMGEARLRSDVGRFHTTMHKWGLGTNASCNCSVEEQTADYILTSCPLRRPSEGKRGLVVLNDKTVTWLLESFPDI